MPQARPQRDRKADHQGRPQRIFHLLHRRNRNDSQRLVEANAHRSKARPSRSRSSIATGPQEYGDQLVRMYLLTNNKDSKLGTTPLPDGIVSGLPRQRPRRALYLAAAAHQVHPDRRQDRTEPGRRSGVIFELIKLQSIPRRHLDADERREHVPQAGRQRGREIELNSSVAGWDDHEVYTQRIRNYTDKPIEVEIRRAFRRPCDLPQRP